MEIAQARSSAFSLAAVLLLITCLRIHAQGAGNNRVPSAQNPPAQLQSGQPRTFGEEPEEELQKGIDLTRRGAFAEAIPHLLAARGRVANDYAASFNLALCYVGDGEFAKAVPVLADLRRDGHDNADVNNLLAQAYVGDREEQKAFESLQRAASFTPTNEKLYMFVADACMASQNYALGLRVADLGLKNLQDSAGLHYERGMFLSLLDQLDVARHDFELARTLAPESDMAYVAAVQEDMLEGKVVAAIRVAREGVSKGREDFLLLTLLGDALLRSGIISGQPEFAEARTALEKSVEQRPNYAGSQLALGKLYLLEDRAADAIMHLEVARHLSAANPAVYSNLAAAYRKQGDREHERDMLAILAQLNQNQAEKIRAAPGDRKASYSGTSEGPETREDPKR